MTMLMMIQVKDLPSLVNIPEWLLHSAAADDAMGFSDVIFPGFLFIVGLSIPFAITGRKYKNLSTFSIRIHIVKRTVALLLVGVFMVNLEYIAADQVVTGRLGWQLLMTLSFFLIWNDYPKETIRRGLFLGMRIAGCVILGFLAAIYQGVGDPTTWMQPHWWGILGLIGWSYFLGATCYLWWGSSWISMAACWAFFVVFNLAEITGGLGFLSGVHPYVWIVGNGSLPALTMAGVFLSTICLRKYASEQGRTFLWFLFVLGILVLILGFGIRPLGDISKIRGTPSWAVICTGIGIVTYAALCWIADLKHQRNWTSIIGPAGTATLTCYLVPYFVYGLMSLADISFPLALHSGGFGLLKSMVFAFVIIWITGLRSRAGIQVEDISKYGQTVSKLVIGDDVP